MKTERIGCFIVRLVAVAGVLFAMGLLAASVAVMIPAWAGTFSYGFVAKPTFSGMFMYGMSILAVWVVFECLYRKYACFSCRAEMFGLALFCLLVHVVFVELLPAMGQIPGAMTYDPLQVLRSMESGKICFFHEARNQGWCNYEIVMSMLATLFNGGQKLGELFQATCCVAALVPLFCIAEQTAGRRMARFTVLVMGLSPGVVMYSTVLTSEFLSAALMLYASFFFLGAMQERRRSSDVTLMLVLSGAFLGLSDLFKVIAVVFLAAAAVFVVVGVLRSGNRRFFLRAALVALVFYPSYRLTRHVGQHALLELAEQRQTASPSGSAFAVILYELALGLNVENEGFYSGKIARKFLSFTPEQQKSYVADMIRKDWKRYPMLMVRKFRNIHGSNNYHHGGVSTFRNAFKGKDGQRQSPRWIIPLADNGTMFFKLLFLFSCIGLALSCTRDFDFGAPGLLALATVLTFAVIEQLIEGHGRYKTAIYPFYFMTLPYMCVWFEKDNPVYVRLARWVSVLALKLKRRGSEC